MPQVHTLAQDYITPLRPLLEAAAGVPVQHPKMLPKYSLGGSMGTVRCGQHGINPQAIVCKHLLFGKYLGFFCDLDDPHNPYPDAWCHSCELIRLEHNGWCQATEDLMELACICGGCYEEIRERNLRGHESSYALQ